MPQVHPQIAKGLQALADANLPPLHTLDVPAARVQMAAMSAARGGEPTPVAHTFDRKIPGPTREIPVRIYWPFEGETSGALLYYHGGGHVIGSLETHDKICRNLCMGGDCVVVSVDYRMGPEDRFPAAVDDSYAALVWVSENAAELRVDPTRLTVGGDSAGGNLAAVVALMARDQGFDGLKLQLLVYPVADYGFGSESHRAFAEGFGILTDKAMHWFRDHYLSTEAETRDWRASPIKAESLNGVAPACVIVAECDVLRDDGQAYSAALMAASVPVEHHFFPGMIHGFFGMTPDVDGAGEAQARACEALKRALG